MWQGSTRRTKTILAAMGVTLAAPMLLIGTLIVLLSSQLASKQPRGAAAQDYARTFHVIIREQGQNTHIWARYLDNAADLRQVVEVNGQIASQQLYIFAEKTLYVSQPSPGQDPTWTKTGNLAPKDIGIEGITAGPAVWARQYGVGDSQVKLQQGNLKITVKSLEKPIAEAVFQPTGMIDLNT